MIEAQPTNEMVINQLQRCFLCFESPLAIGLIKQTLAKVQAKINQWIGQLCCDSLEQFALTRTLRSGHKRKLEIRRLGPLHNIHNLVKGHLMHREMGHTGRYFLLSSHAVAYRLVVSACRVAFNVLYGGD